MPAATISERSRSSRSGLIPQRRRIAAWSGNSLASRYAKGDGATCAGPGILLSSSVASPRGSQTYARVPERTNCSHVYYGEVHVGEIASRPGLPVHFHQWACHGAGTISDNEAQRLADAASPRHSAAQSPRKLESISRAVLTFPRAKAQRSPDKASSIERRRHLAASWQGSRCLRIRRRQWARGCPAGETNPLINVLKPSGCRWYLSSCHSWADIRVRGPLATTISNSRRTDDEA